MGRKPLKLKSSAGKAHRFQDLMPLRITEVLLVASPFDAFILEEDGLLTEQVFLQYRWLSLSAPPRFTHAPTGRKALVLLRKRNFDLVIAMSSISDMSVGAFGRRVKKEHPGRPVVLLSLDRKDLLLERRKLDPAAVDCAFLWAGDALILLAIVKHVEDRHNAEHDVKNGDVRVILVLEDTPRYYSSFLAMLYRELMDHSHSLYEEGASEVHRRMQMRSRPKILLATTFEEARELYQRFRNNILAVISDVRIPRGGKLDARAGLDFVRQVRRRLPDVPVLLQSSESGLAEKAESLGLVFVPKASPHMLARVRAFVQESLGFGDFIFRRPSGEEVARARDLGEFEKEVADIPDDSLVYHVSLNHFSIWLMARSEFAAARELRPVRVEDFPTLEGLRQHLIEVLRRTHREARVGVVSDFSRERFAEDRFLRLGKGALGGKGRGLAFLYLQLAGRAPDVFGGLPVRLPKTVVIGTEVFDQFLAENSLRDFAYTASDDQELKQRFLAGRLPLYIRRELDFLAENMWGPLTARSSSLLEDSLHQPFAGIYCSMVVTVGRDRLALRRRRLEEAIKLVYASAFTREARAYLERTQNRIEEEKMAVILQRVVGQEHGGRFYPSFSGVAQSYNFYPIGPQKPEDGVAQLALGLGRTVVDGGQALRFSPAHPKVFPPYVTLDDLLDRSQRGFCALDLDLDQGEEDRDPEGNIVHFPLRQAEEDGTLHALASVYSQGEEALREDLEVPGPRLVTFANILKHGGLPLAPALREILSIAERGLGTAVEIEFAAELWDWGRPLVPGEAIRRDAPKPELYLLQMRPFAARLRVPELVERIFSRGRSLCASRASLGHGIEEGVRDLVYVRPETWEVSHNQALAKKVAKLNRRLERQGRPYILVGPGRWGSSDPFLGIPVTWEQITGVRVLVEASPAGYAVEPSQGMHFFQNLTSLRIGYLTIPPGVSKEDPEQQDYLDWRWLEAQEAHTEDGSLRHLRFAEPMTVVLDGRKGHGVISRPGAGAKRG